MTNPDASIKTPTPEIELTALATRIKQGHEALSQSFQTIVPRAIAIGDLLNEAKAKIGHGTFLKWVADNCQLNERTVQRYMKLAEGKAKLNAKIKSDIVSDLTLNEAMRLIDERETTTPTTASGATTSSTNNPSPSKPTALDRFDKSWSNLDHSTQTAFVEANYQELSKLMREVDRKTKQAA
jgi:hypothetical protein